MNLLQQLARLRSGVVPLVILAISLGGFFLLLAQREQPATATTPEPELVVQTVQAQPHDHVQIEVEGHVVPRREVMLAAEVSGRIIQKTDQCRAGNYVEAGQLLFEIDPRDYQLELQRTQLELAQTQTQLEELQQQIAGTERLIALAQERVELAARDVKRQMSLSSGGAASTSTLDRARQTQLTSRNALLKLENQLRLQIARRAGLERGLQVARVELNKAQLNLARTRVTAPVSGVVVDDLVEEESYVMPGTSLAVMEDTSAVEVSCMLRLEELRWLWSIMVAGESEGGSSAGFTIPPTPVTVVYSMAGREYLWDGLLTRYEGQGIDEHTRTIACRVEVAQPRAVRLAGDSATAALPYPPALVRGMFVSVRLRATVPPGTLLALPEAAIRPGNKAWVVREGKLVEVPVEVVQLVEQRPRRATHYTVHKMPLEPKRWEVDGLVVPHREVVLSAQLAGIVAQKSEQVETGAFVPEGTPLLKIDSQDYQLLVEQLQSQLEQARTSLEELSVEISGTEELVGLAQQELALQQRELARVERLEGRGTSQWTVEQARADQLTARQSLVTVQNQLDLLQIRRKALQSSADLVEVRLNEALLDLERTSIAAPFDGVVVSDSADRGDYVQPGTPLMTLLATSAVEVRCHLGLDQVAQLVHAAYGRSSGVPPLSADGAYELPETAARVIYRLGGRAYGWEGTLMRYDGIGVDSQTRTVACRVLVPEPGRAHLVDAGADSNVTGAPPSLLRGMYVSVQLEAAPGVQWLSRQTTDNRVAANMAIIDTSASAIAAGDKVVVSPLPRAETGMIVKEQPEQ